MLVIPRYLNASHGRPHIYSSNATFRKEHQHTSHCHYHPNSRLICRHATGGLIQRGRQVPDKAHAAQEAEGFATKLATTIIFVIPPTCVISDDYTVRDGCTP